MSGSSGSKNDYTEVVIVAENEWHSRKQKRSTVCIYNTLWDIGENLAMPENNTIDQVICQKLFKRENCHAEVLFISDNALRYKVRDKFVTDDKDNSNLARGRFGYQSVVIRILEEKQKFLKEFDNRSAADVTFVVNGEECKADRMWMGTASPVFITMLYGLFGEAQQDKIVLEEIESVKIFKDFLLAVSPLRIQPNPSNVVSLLKLAYQYNIPFLMRSCEGEICYEISPVDRILLAGKYGLDSLKTRTMQHLSDDDFLEILREKSDQLCEPGCRFLHDIIADRMEEMQFKIKEFQKTQRNNFSCHSNA